MANLITPAVRRWIAGGVVVIVMAAVVVLLAVTNPLRARGSAGSSAGLYHPQTYTVTRQSLTSQAQEDATLGDAGSYSVVDQAQGSPAARAAARSRRCRRSGPWCARARCCTRCPPAR